MVPMISTRFGAQACLLRPREQSKGRCVARVALQRPQDAALLIPVFEARIELTLPASLAAPMARHPQAAPSLPVLQNPVDLRVPASH